MEPVPVTVKITLLFNPDEKEIVEKAASLSKKQLAEFVKDFLESDDRTNKYRNLTKDVVAYAKKIVDDYEFMKSHVKN